MKKFMFPQEPMRNSFKMRHRRLVLHVVLPICTVILIVAAFVDVLYNFHLSGASRSGRAVDKSLSHSHESLRNFIDIAIRVAPLFPKQVPDSTFLPPSHYVRDPRGAIEVFRKDGVVMCRVYIACREHTSEISFPSWMKKHSRIFSDTCGLSNFRFVNFSRRRLLNNTRIKYKGVYDWLAPHLPAHALPAFVSSPLSKFYAPNNASKSKLAKWTKVQRACYSAGNATKGVCGMEAEPRISRPLFILDSEVMESSLSANLEFEEALHVAVDNKHATEATIISISGDEVDKKQRLCVRSIVSAPSADHEAGETIADATIVESGQTQSTRVKETLKEADGAIEDEMESGK